MSKKRRKVYQRRAYLQKRKNGIYYIYHQLAGRQVRISTRSMKRLQAEAELDRYITSLDEGNSLTSRRVTLHQGIDDWFSDRKCPSQGLSKATLSGYKTFVAKLKGVIPAGLLVRDFKRANVREALRALVRQGESQIQVSKCRTILSQVCNFLVAEDLMPFNYCMTVKQPARYQKRPAMTEEEYLALIKVLNEECKTTTGRADSKKTALDLLDLCQLCWNTGFRYVEWTRLRWKDVDWENQTITTHSPANKGGEQTRRVSKKAFTILEQRKRNHGPIFPGEYRRLLVAWQRFRKRHPQFKDFRLHGMRRAFITRIHQMLGPAAAMHFGGHKSPTMTGLYTDQSQMNWDEGLENCEFRRKA